MTSNQERWPVRRHFRRFEVPAKPATVVAHVFARLFDVSVKGLSVETPVPLKLGKTYSFDLSETGEILILQGAVSWSQIRGSRKDLTEGTQPVYISGVNLVDLSPENEQGLMKFIEKHADISATDRLFARLLLAPDECQSVETALGVRITRISLNRLQFESELALNPGVTCQISFRLGPHEITGTGRLVSIEEIANASPDRRHVVGMELTQISPGCREVLDRFIKRELARIAVRNGEKVSGNGDRQAGRDQPPTSKSAPRAVPPSVIKGNVKSRIFHESGCRNYGARACTAVFQSREEALAAGYRECQSCGSEQE